MPRDPKSYRSARRNAARDAPAEPRPHGMRKAEQACIAGIILSLLLAVGTNAVSPAFGDAHEGFRAIALVICGIGVLVCILYLFLLYISWHRRELVVLSVLGIVSLIIIGVCKGSVFFIPNYMPTPLTLRNLFDTAFSTYPSISQNATQYLTLADGTTLKVPMRVINDFDGRSRFLSFYLTDAAFDASAHIVKAYHTITNNIQHWAIQPTYRHGGDNPTDTELKFTGQVYLYTELPFTMEQQGDIAKEYSK